MMIIDPLVQEIRIKALEENVIRLLKQVERLEKIEDIISKRIKTLTDFMQAQARLNVLAGNRFENIESILELMRKLRELDEEEK